MFQPTEFLDGNNIIIIKDIPYYRYTGVTYKEKLKNGLSFDYVFGLEYCLPNTENEDNIDNDKTTAFNNDKKTSFNNYEYFNNCEYIDFYEKREYEKRKFKYLSSSFKKRQSKNTKKNRIRQIGYTIKLFNIEQFLPDISEDYNVINETNLPDISEDYNVINETNETNNIVNDVENIDDDIDYDVENIDADSDYDELECDCCSIWCPICTDYW